MEAAPASRFVGQAAARSPRVSFEFFPPEDR